MEDKNNITGATAPSAVAVNAAAPVTANKSNRITADDEADACLEIQLSLSKKSKTANWLVTILTMGFIFTFAILIWVLPNKTFSPEENRTLKTVPDFTAEKFFSGDFTGEFSVFMADQFPARNYFVGLKALVETVMLKDQNNDIITAANGYLVARNDYPDETNLQTNLSAVNAFINAAEKKGITCTAAFAGRKQDVCDNLLPKVYGSYYSDRIWNRLDSIAKQNGLSYINLRDPLRIASQSDDGLYYKTDHHWTSHGAYLAYREIANAMGKKPQFENDFNITTASDSFFGTTWSSSGVKWSAPDTIEYYRFDGDDNYKMEILEPSGKFEGYNGCTYTEKGGDKYAVFDGFYVKEFLLEKDKYASFIGGNFGLTKITKNTDEERQTILLLKDSFAHSVVPFLAKDYDLVLVDLRYYKKSMLRFCEENGIDNVLFLYNMETLCEGNYLNVLKAGLNK